MLIDTNVLIRTTQRRHAQYEVVRRAVEWLPQQGNRLHIVPQNLVEMWVVATRPVAQNGPGLTVDQAASEIDWVKDHFKLLPDGPTIYPQWEALVREHGVSGKPAHDARLVAAMKVHGLTSILTFDRTGFTRFPGITPVHPGSVLPTAPFH